jgi:hypothetical protein
MPGEIDHTNTKEIVCPYCGQEVSDSWEYPEYGEHECDCGQTFNYSRRVSVTYFSEKINDAPI